MRDMRKYEELLPEEFAEAMRESSIIYCAFGPMEYHGIYNALGIDPGKAYEICLRAAAISGGVVFPLVPIGPGGSMRVEEMLDRDGLRAKMPQHYPSVMTDVGICRRLYVDLLKSFAEDLGCAVCVAFGGHGPCGSLIKRISEENGGEIAGMKLLACWSLSHNLDVAKAEYERLGVSQMQHGGLWETAMNMAVNPDFVQLGRLEGAWPDRFLRYTAPLEGLSEIDTRTMLALGQKLMDVAAERIAAEARALLESCR